MLAVIVCLSLSCFTSCGGAALAADVVGIYELDKSAVRAALLSSIPAEARKEKMATDMVDTVVSGMSAVIELKVDGSMHIHGQGKDAQATGSWKLDGSNLTLVTKRNDGREELQTAPYRNGAFALDLNEGGQTIQVKFKRK